MEITNQDMKNATFVCCPMCDKEKCVGRFKCEEIKRYVEERKKDSKEVEQGEWETVPNKVVEHGEVVIRGTAERCSKCFHASSDFKKNMNYCPNCGAKMRELENE